MHKRNLSKPRSNTKKIRIKKMSWVCLVIGQHCIYIYQLNSKDFVVLYHNLYNINENKYRK